LEGKASGDVEKIAEFAIIAVKSKPGGWYA